MCRRVWFAVRLYAAAVGRLCPGAVFFADFTDGFFFWSVAVWSTQERRKTMSINDRRSSLSPSGSTVIMYNGFYAR